MQRLYITLSFLFLAIFLVSSNSYAEEEAATSVPISQTQDLVSFFSYQELGFLNELDEGAIPTDYYDAGAVSSTAVSVEGKTVVVLDTLLFDDTLYHFVQSVDSLRELGYSDHIIQEMDRLKYKAYGDMMYFQIENPEIEHIFVLINPIQAGVSETSYDSQSDSLDSGDSSHSNSSGSSSSSGSGARHTESREDIVTAIEEGSLFSDESSDEICSWCYVEHPDWEGTARGVALSEIYVERNNAIWFLQSFRLNLTN